MRVFWFPILLFCFCLLFLSLVLWKIHPYQNATSSLIGIWEGFAEINPNIAEPGDVIYKDGGYDGQFFYYLAKSMFADLEWDVIVDSYYFRLHRIGFTLLVGLPASIIGFSNYATIGLSISLFLFLTSVLCLYQLLPKEHRYLTVFYLFSPYSLNSHLLLVADGVFTSLFIITIFLLEKQYHLIVILLVATLTVFTRELGIILLIPIVISNFSLKDYKFAVLYSFPILLFISFLIWTRSSIPNHLGTNPLGFGDMIDYPLFGFVKSFFDNGIFHLSPKESTKLLLFLQASLLIAFFSNSFLNKSISIKDIFSNSKNTGILLLPILASLSILLIAEQGYWRSFDNLSRMFTLSVPLVILLKSRVNSKLLDYFLYLSLILFFFLVLRILFITQIKDFYISP